MSGGEPICHPEFNDIVEQLSSQNMLVYLSTNGVLLNRKYLSDSTIKLLDWIRVSIHSTDSKYAKLIMGSEYDCRKVLENIKETNKLNNKISAICVLNKFNTEENILENLINDLIDVGINKVDFGLLKLLGCQTSEDFPSIQTIEKMNDYLSKTFSLKKLNLKFPNVTESEKPHNCVAKRYSLSIMPIGSIKQCAFSEKSLGNVYEDSILNIWKRNNRTESYHCKECQKGGHYHDEKKEV